MNEAGTQIPSLDAGDSVTELDDNARVAPDTVSEKLNDALTPSFQAEFDPDEAETAGAFFEGALSQDDAMSSAHDSAHFAPHTSPPKS
jgi:hypothetical protein